MVYKQVEMYLFTEEHRKEYKSTKGLKELKSSRRTDGEMEGREPGWDGGRVRNG